MADEFSEAVKEYYNSKSEYIALIEAASKELENREAEHPTQPTASKAKQDSETTWARRTPSQGTTHLPTSETVLELPKVPLFGGIEGMDPRRASELIAEMRTTIEKGNNKELKELLGKLDRGMGLQTSSSRSR